MIRKSGSYISCMECRRVFQEEKLKKEKKEADYNELTCPYCGSTRFTKKFSNVFLSLDPDKSEIAKKVDPELDSGMYAFLLE